jgi:DNA (cytosine-5)-methyltransferase 1
MQRRPIGIDLFAGAGGLALGFEQAGFDVLTSVEYDAVHAAVHQFNFPMAEVLCADISKLSAERLLGAARSGAERHGIEWDGEVDVIFGGPPCQGFSLIGQRVLEDPRNQLVFHFYRLIAEIQPRYFVMENVPGMLRGAHSGVLAQLIENFEAAGYQVAEHQLLNAADYGVPQERKRLILMGARKGLELPAYPQPTVEQRPKRAPLGAAIQPLIAESGLPLGPSVWEAIGDLPDLDTFEELMEADRVLLDHELSDELQQLASGYGKRMRGLIVDDDDYSHPRAHDQDLLTASTRTLHTRRVHERFARVQQGATEPTSRFYRPSANGLCNTLRAGSGSERGAHTAPRPIHPLYPRVISNREAARIHSFPDWFQPHVTKWHGFRQIGNAVAPLLARAVAGSLIEAMNIQPVRPTHRIDMGDEALLRMKPEQAIAHFGADRLDGPAARRRAADQPQGA